MKTIPQIILLFLAMLWRIGYAIDAKTRLAPRKSRKKRAAFATPLIGIGSLLAGGAGKTPYAAFLAGKLKSQGFKVGILCKNTGDENIWLEKKGFDVFAGNRLKLCEELDGKYDVLISDDGLEDRRLSHAFWVCLSWGERACSLRDIIPAGRCRSLWKDHPEIACVKKCAMEWDEASESADIVFRMKPPENLSGDALPDNSEIAALAGIARPRRFFAGLSKRYKVAKEIALKDHSKNIQREALKALKLGLPVAITEKDAVKLDENILRNRNIYICRLELTKKKRSAQTA